jgi:serine phosphatase RsbU (regulator of sigma subunit)
MLGITLLDEIVNKKGITTASLILDEMKASVIKHLKQQGRQGETQDGMDITLCSIDKKTLKLEMAGAYNPLYLIRKGELIRIKADRMPIGIYYKKTKPFTNNEVQLQKGDMLYMFSDGYIDQFSGDTGEKLMTRNFKKYLLEIYKKPLAEQKVILEQKFDLWKADAEQIDDIIVFGVRIS